MHAKRGDGFSIERCVNCVTLTVDLCYKNVMRKGEKKQLKTIDSTTDWFCSFGDE